jgi:YD repeat-containing protein
VSQGFEASTSAVPCKRRFRCRRLRVDRFACGACTRLDYNAFNQLTKITDPLSGQTTLGYDPNRNLRSVTDARGKVTGYDPDVMDRVQTRTDPRGKTETYVYDSNVRRGQVLKSNIGVGITSCHPTRAMPGPGPPPARARD